MNCRVQVEGHFVTDGVSRVAVPLYQKTTCKVVLNVHVGMLIGDRSAVQLRLRGLLL